MLRLTLVPQVHHLSTVDASVVFGPDATVADLALAVTNHYRDLGELPGGHTVAPVAPTGRWPPDLRLADAGLRSGAALAVIVMDESWFSAADEGTRPMAIAHVAAGPSSGAEFPIHHDTARIGRDPSCEIRLNDPLVSRVHARVRLADPPEVQDEGSANGTQIDGVDVAGNTTLGWRQRLTVGDSEIWLEPLGRGAQATDGSTAGAVAVLRPPRLEATFVPRDLHIATPPERPTPQPPPWLTSALPLLMGAILWVVTKSLLAVVFTALSPMLFIGAWWESRRAAEREYQRKLERHRKHVGEQIGTLLIDQQLEREYLLSEFPDPSDLLRLVSSRAPRLWARQPRDLDFLDVRVGIGTKPSATTLTVEQGGEPDDLDKLNKQVEEHRTMSDVPILARLTESRSLAVVAPRTSEDGELRTVLLQLAIDHSPADVELVGILGPARAMHIEWLKWLPHATGEFTRYEHPFAVGAAEGRQLVERIIESATGEASAEGRRAHTLVVVDEDANLPRDVVERLLAVGREEPIFVIWTGARRETVPTSIALVLDSLSAPAPNLAPGQIATLPPVPGDGELGTLWSAQRTPPSEAIRPDRLGQPAAVASARSLAACVDVSAAVPQSQALPDAVRLPNLMADLTDPDDMDTVVQRWSQSRGLRGQVGMGVEGTFTLDLRADGPHGLVAGTTGSGKSELLQTLILSLAINNPPDRLTFLLVDYKGGAAFKECGELPHTVGYITDLTTSLVNRALTSLGAEITKREHALDRYGAKNLIDLEASHPQACPPSLLIVVDEFAALAAEVPDFVNGMVNIAQRGRSLGMHMILATQRPQGVITENIRDNTDLRIALRVAADADSQDVIGVSDAAHVSRRTPGRAWIRRIGQGEATPVQSAFVGARKPPGAIDPPVELRDFTVRASQARVAALLAPDDPVMTAPTDLERLVVTVGRAADETGISSGPPPWVKELGSMVTFRPLRRSVLEITDQTGTGKNVLPPMTTSPGDAAVPVGLADEPLLQRQSPISLDYRSKGSYLVLGTSGSGKTELLRSIALSLSIPCADPPPHIYVIDFAGRGLGSLEALPNVGSIVYDDDHPRLFRLLRWLQRTIAARAEEQALLGVGDIDAQRPKTDEPLPRIHVLFDGFVSFLGAMEQSGRTGRRYVDMLVELIQTGRRTGVHFTFSAAQRTGIESALLTALQGRVVMRLTTPEEYSYFGLEVGAIAADDPAGRCFVGREPAQVMTIGDPGETEQRERIDALARSLPEIEPPHRVSSMPDRVAPGEDGAHPPRHVVVGVDFDQLDPAVVNLGTDCFFIGGRSLSGKSSVLAGIAANAAKSATPPNLLLLGSRAAEIVHLAPWSAVHDTPLSAGQALESLIEDLESQGSERGWTMVCIDDLQDWEDDTSSREGQYELIGQIKALVERRKQLGVSFLVSVDTDHAKSSYSDHLNTLMRRDRLGILLRPDDVDGSLLGTDLPGTYEGQRTPGRGFLCRQGLSRLTQAVSAGSDRTVIEPKGSLRSEDDP